MLSASAFRVSVPQRRPTIVVAMTPIPAASVGGGEDPRVRALAEVTPRIAEPAGVRVAQTWPSKRLVTEPSSKTSRMAPSMNTELS